MDPERPLQSVEFQRSVAGGPWTSLGTDSSAPAYTATDDVSALPLGTSVRYRAILSEHGAVQSTSAPVTVTTAPPQPAVASVTVAGDLQQSSGCPGDWDPACATTHLAFDTTDGKWHGTFTAARRQLAVEGRDQRLLDRQLRRQRRRGQHHAVGADATADYVFTWNQVTHVPSVAPAG